MDIYAKTDTGRVRSINQDCFDFTVLDLQSFCAIVCDGMGGTKAGEVASLLACETAKKYIVENFKENLSDEKIKELIINSIKISNEEIFKKAQENKNYLGMGTTIVLALICKNTIHIAHIGDSRAYIISNKKIEQLTKDHSMVQEMVESGEITSEQAKNHPKKNIITRALGVSKDIEIDYKATSLKENDVIFLCTDGLSNYIDDKNILKYIKKYSGQEIVDRLVDKANELGGNDNITALIMQNNLKV